MYYVHAYQLTESEGDAYFNWSEPVISFTESGCVGEPYWFCTCIKKLKKKKKSKSRSIMKGSSLRT